jgi:L-aminopeptidase/D-esterase-like protein
MEKEKSLNIEGLLIGHYTDLNNITGCTVALFPQGAIAGMDVRGGAPGTRACDSLVGFRSSGRIHAVLFTGGSTFGLGATDGVLRFLLEKGWGVKIDHLTVPLVPSAVIFDLFIGSSRDWPGPREGYEACVSAGETTPLGSVGAGTGAVVGKLLGKPQGTKGGIGWALVQANTLKVGCLTVVNAFGDVVDPATGKVLAGARDPRKGGFLITSQAMKRGILRHIPDFTTNTTLALVVTNASLSRNGCIRVSQMAHGGMTRVISHFHTDFDGDLVITASVGSLNADTNLVGLMAAQALEEAIITAVKAATPLGGIPSWGEIPR